jgi:hypothetical protein
VKKSKKLFYAVILFFSLDLFANEVYPQSIDQIIQCEKAMSQVQGYRYDIPSKDGVTAFRYAGFMYLFRQGKVYQVPFDEPEMSSEKININLEGNSFCMTYNANLNWLDGDSLESFHEGNCDYAKKGTAGKLLNDQALKELKLAQILERKLEKHISKEARVCEYYLENKDKEANPAIIDLHKADHDLRIARFAGWNSTACEGFSSLKQPIQKIKACTKTRSAVPAGAPLKQATQGTDS